MANIVINKNKKGGIKMFCQNCGTEMNEGAKFCLNCGTATNGTQTTQSHDQKIPATAVLSHYGSVGVYEFLETLEPNLDFIWVQSDNSVKAYLVGIAAVAMIKTYILAFNTQSIYVCQLDNLSRQKIVNITKYAWSEIKSFTASGSLVGKTLKFDTKYGDRRFRTQKLFNAENQGNRIEKLLQMQK